MSPNGCDRLRDGIPHCVSPVNHNKPLAFKDSTSWLFIWQVIWPVIISLRLVELVGSLPNYHFCFAGHVTTSCFDRRGERDDLHVWKYNFLHIAVSRNRVYSADKLIRFLTTEIGVLSSNCDWKQLRSSRIYGIWTPYLRSNLLIYCFFLKAKKLYMPLIFINLFCNIITIDFISSQ